MLRKFILGLALLFGAFVLFVYIRVDWDALKIPSKEVQQKVRIENLYLPLKNYHYDFGQYPSTSEGLSALMENKGDDQRWNGPYMEPQNYVDEWGSTYQYELTDKGLPHIRSSGPDMQPGTADDISID